MMNNPSEVLNIIMSMKPKPLALPIPPHSDHSHHMLMTALDGYAELAADHILHPEAAAILSEIVSGLIRRSELLIRDALDKRSNDDIATIYRIYNLFIELIANLNGVEVYWARLPQRDVDIALNRITHALSMWEALEREKLGYPKILETAINLKLRSMELVNGGKSLVAHFARIIRSRLDNNRLAESFAKAVSEVLRDNSYRIIYMNGMCKFGNDYALGLRWLRHLGFVQVSTNPVLAARAYSDDPSLWDKFREYAETKLVKMHPEWFRDPERYADDITMEATRFALLDSFFVFRVPFILSNGHDGLVSYQLNPLIANDVEKSVRAAIEFVKRLEQDLIVYDSYLLWGYQYRGEVGRANIVIKVAAPYPEAQFIAERLNELGIGTNITLSYTVSQEVLLAWREMRGMAKALKKGIIPTQVYDTNMGGRLEDHLREEVAAQLLFKALENVDESRRRDLIIKFGKSLGVKDSDLEKILSQDLLTACRYLTSHRILGRNMLRKEFIVTLAETGFYGSLNDVEKMLIPLEDALKLSGTYVAQRVYDILFSPRNRAKWVEYLVREFGLSREEAEFIIDRIDLLPASKRKPIDTLYTFASRNMTNTEFPDHQLAVVQELGKRGGYRDLVESIYIPLGREYLDILMKMEDFVKAYEASPEVNKLLKEIGIEGDFGARGIDPHEWPSYGPCRKTLEEFTSAYIVFRDSVIKIVKSIQLR